MSFLGGRLAGAEGSYFFQESKHAVARLAAKKKLLPPPSDPPAAAASTGPYASSDGQAVQADILPEVLKHSLPPNIFRQHAAAAAAAAPSDSSFSRSSTKWSIIGSEPKNVSSVSPDALNPLRAYVSFPQVTFGPKRWELPHSQHSVVASTANELRRDNDTHVNPEKLKAVAEGLSQIGKAFVVATTIIFGGATLIFGLVASKLELHSGDDLRANGRDILRPKYEMFREQLIPFKKWGDKMSTKWHLEREGDIKEKPMIKELSKKLRLNASK